MTQPIDTTHMYFLAVRAANDHPVDDENSRLWLVRLFDVRKETPVLPLRRAAERALQGKGYVFAPSHGPGGAA